MRTYLILCFLSICIFFSSCNGESTSSNTTPSKTKTETPSNLETPKGLHKEVMRIHDEAMAKMDLIYQMKKQIKEARKNVGRLENPEQAKGTIKTLLDGLDFADEGMMYWMRNYRQPKKQTDKEKMVYLQWEKAKIEVVGRIMNEEIKKAERFLEEMK